MTFGREIRLLADIVFGKPEEPTKSACDYVANLEKMADMHHTACKNIAVYSDQAKARYDRQANAIYFKKVSKSGSTILSERREGN